jgi:hypothetical protein
MNRDFPCLQTGQAYVRKMAGMPTEKSLQDLVDCGHNQLS